MDTLILILQFTIPALLVFLTAYFLLKSLLEQYQKNQETEQAKQRRELITPLQLQAYERLILYIERINPENLVIRENNPAFNAAQLHVALLAAVRQEFEHNLSQQLYVSKGAWLAVKNCREDILHIIHQAKSKVADNAMSAEFAGAIFEEYLKQNVTSIQKAADFLHEEVNKRYA